MIFVDGSYEKPDHAELNYKWQPCREFKYLRSQTDWACL